MAPVLQAKLCASCRSEVRARRRHAHDTRGRSRRRRDEPRLRRGRAAEGAFRQDLYYRLNVVSFEMPPLRDRREDIPLLATHFAELIAKRFRRAPLKFSPAAIRRLRGYEWPGNVRELENAVERAVVLSSGPEIAPDDLPEALAESPVSEAAAESRFHAAVTESKRRVVLEAIDEANGRLTDAARLLGLHPNYLFRLLRNLKLRD
jgi:DNA-binding NtrC family response regulator